MTEPGPSPRPFEGVPGLKKVTIHVGDIFASRKPAVVQTLLGSCVSVCLMDCSAKVAGMNHILLPGKASLDNFDDAARYGVNAMERLIAKVRQLGAERRKLEAKVFGGANIINGMESSFNSGFRNGIFAMEFLDREGIPVVGRDVGGYNARRVYLRTDTGEVFLKRIPRYQAAGIILEEKEFRQRVQGEMSKSGQAVLFKK